jgi:ABC-type transport system involved in cytochrome bd biosynthesis fused ATPase/permease subunit
MLQRIQSVYLLLACLALYTLFLFPFAHNVYVDGKPASIMITGVYEDVNGMRTHTQFFVALTVATVIIGLVPLVIIFFYKNRKRQIALCYGAILVIIGYSFWVSQTVKEVMGSIQLDTHNWGIGLFLTTISLLFIVFAFKAIQRDEKLVKSADRLR